MEYLPIFLLSFGWMLWMTHQVNKQDEINKTNQHLFVRVLEHLSKPNASHASKQSIIRTIQSHINTINH